MYAYRLMQVDETKKMHEQAWINNRVKATKENGKPVYRRFKDFYDYEKAIKEVENVNKKVTSKMRRMAQIAMKANEGR